MNNTSHTQSTMVIPANISRTAAIKKIKEKIQSSSGVITIDLTEATFPLHRDFFLVLSKKFPRDKMILRLKNDALAQVAKSLWLETEVLGVWAEFEKKYGKNTLTTHNMSMFEYLVYEMKRWWYWLKYIFFERKRWENKLPHYKKNNSNIILIIIGLISSLTLLLFIFHFAISKTIISITPQISVKPVGANIVYRMEWTTGSILTSKSTIPLKKLTFTSSTATKFKIETIDPNSAQNAQWTVTIYNELTSAQELRPATRFMTADWVVYRSVDWAKLPASRSLNGITEMWVTEVNVVADVNDENGKIIGSRGNIKSGTDLIIPGLKFNQDKIYAKAKSDFTGWDDPKVHVVTEDEIKKFENVMSGQILKVARDEVQKRLEAEKQKTGLDYVLLLGDGIKFSNPTFEITSWQKIGDTAEEVEITAKTDVIATVFDRKATVDYLTTVFRENLLQWTNKEIAIHPDTLRVSNIISRAEDDSEIKATLEMNTSTAYDFENSSNELTKRLKNIIAGLSNKEATEKLINDWQVKEVSIKNYPFWVGSISSNIDNIEFSIKQ